MQILINDGWSFVKLRSGSSFDDAEKAGFEPVDLPHDWLIWQETDLYESADAWYRRSIELPAEHDPVVMIRFDGVYMDCDVLLNGAVICTHPYGYTAFDVPLTGRLREGENILTVHIRHRSPNSRWYSGSGIFRDVFLVILPENHMIPDSLYTVEKETDGKWYHVKYGKILRDTTLIKYNNKWYHIKNGVKSNYTGLFKYNGVWYYIKKR